jgi:POT family proton-dependent oligopeptide transporter
MVASLGLGLLWILNDPYSKISGNNLLDFTVGSLSGANFTIILGVAIFLVLLIGRITRYSKVTRDRLIAVTIFAFFTVFFWASFEQAGGSMTIFAEKYTNRAFTGAAATMFKIVNTLLTIVPLGIISYVLFKLFRQTFKRFALGNIILGTSFVVIWGVVIWMLNREFSNPNTEVPASWFGILNSFFIIAFAPMVSRIWESKYNPPAAVKYGLGMTLLGLGFASLAYGASGIISGEASIKVSMIWLILAYLFHTLGELCLSPVGLSYVSKLVPARMIGIMFGIWYLAIAIGNKTAGSMGGMINEITAKYSLTTFFLIFTLIPIGLGILVMILHPLLKKLMHGVK